MIVIYRLILCESPEQFQLYPAKTLQSDDLRLSFFQLRFHVLAIFQEKGNNKSIPCEFVRKTNLFELLRAHMLLIYSEFQCLFMYHLSLLSEN